MNWSDLMGYCAAVLTTVSFVPQAWLTFRTRNVQGISLVMYSSFTLGVALWLGYGLVMRAWPLVVANAVTLVLALSILFMKLRFGGGPRLSADETARLIQSPADPKAR
jgi:MtN3 and saliva related transmembrane protein